MTEARRDTYPAVDRRDGSGPSRRTVSTAVRVLVGAGGVMLGLFVGGVNATGYEAEWNVSVFSGVVIIGGMVMIAQAWHRPRISRADRIVGTAVGAVGLLASVVVPVQRTCCDAAWAVSLGTPLPWTTGGGDTWSQAAADAWRDTWDPVSAMSNAIFWAYAGMLVAVLVGLFPRAKRA